MPSASDRWRRAVEEFRNDPKLYEDALRSVMSDMAYHDGQPEDRERSVALFERALMSEPLIFPGRAAVVHHR